MTGFPDIAGKTALSLLLMALLTLFMAVKPDSGNAQTAALISDESFRADAREAIDSLYNRKPDAASDILQPWKKDEPDHPLWMIWDGMTLWWDILQDLSSEEYDEQFFEKMARADHAAATLLRRERDHPDGLIVRAIATGYMARHHANRGDWITSVTRGRRAYQAYSRLMEVMPDLPDNEFAQGMLKYYAAFIPDEYPAVRAVSWFLPDGDRDDGLSRLAKASEEGVFAAPEATYFLGNILLNYENQYEEAAGYFSGLVERYPDNAYYRRLHLRTLFQMRRFVSVGEEGEKAFAHWEKHGDELKDHDVLREEVYYWMGRAAFSMRQSEQASEHFVRAWEMGLELPNSDSRQVHTLAAYFAGRAYEQMDDQSRAETYYRRAMELNGSDEAKRLAGERVRNL